MPLGGTIILGRPATIPWTAVQVWAVHHDLTCAEMALLDRCLIEMDKFYIEDWKQKNKQGQKK